MNEKFIRKFIVSLSKNLDEEKFASLVSYFSITQGNGTLDVPDLTLFPPTDSDINKVRLINLLKSELNFFGMSVKKFNQGVRILKKIDELEDSKVDKKLLEYIKSINPYEDFPFIENQDNYKLTFSYDGGDCYSTSTRNKSDNGLLLFKQDRTINLDLLSIAKFSQAIHEELNILDVHLIDTFNTLTRTSLIHEKSHLHQHDFYVSIEKLRYLKKENPNMEFSQADALEFAKYHLSFEYEAWENSFRKDKGFYRRKIINEALCNMGIASYIVQWLVEIYFCNEFSVPYEDLTFSINTSV